MGLHSVLMFKLENAPFCGLEISTLCGAIHLSHIGQVIGVHNGPTLVSRQVASPTSQHVGKVAVAVVGFTTPDDLPVGTHNFHDVAGVEFPLAGLDAYGKQRPATGGDGGDSPGVDTQRTCDFSGVKRPEFPSGEASAVGRVECGTHVGVGQRAGNVGGGGEQDGHSPAGGEAGRCLRRHCHLQ